MLPYIEHPILKIFIHSLDRTVNFRPFLVKEEKVLLIAKESQDYDEIRQAVVQIVSNCCMDKTIDVEKLPIYDIEMIFLKLRAKSVGEKVQLVFNCKNEVDGEICGTDTDYQLDLDKVKYVVPEGHTDTIKLTDKVGMKLKTPTLEQGFTFDEQDQVFNAIMGVLFNYVEYIYDDESKYKPEEFGEEEFNLFMENLTVEQLDQIKAFFETSPKVVLEDDVTCKKCGYIHHIESEDLLSFFI